MDDDDKTPDPPANPPADPPAPPPTDNRVTELESIVASLREEMKTLAAQVEDLTTDHGTQDSTPVGKPWTARGRR